MKSNKTTRKLIAGITLAAGVAGLGAGAAGAQTTQPSTVPNAAQQGPGHGHRGGPGRDGAVLASLVKAGTLTQAKADAIAKAFDAARPQRPTPGANTGASQTPPANRPDPAAAHKAVLDSLVKAGTITQADADAVQKGLDAARPQGMPQGVDGQGAGQGRHGARGHGDDAVIISLVRAGTLTQAKADAIAKAFDAARPQRPTPGANTGASQTPPANRPDPAAAHKAVLDSLVKAGTITQADADAVQKALESARPQGPQGVPPMRAAGQAGARGPVSSTHGS